MICQMRSVAKGCRLTATCSHETARGANPFCCVHGSDIIFRQFLDSSFCRSLTVSVNIIPAESLTLTATYAGSRAEQHLEGSITRSQFSERISGQPCFLVAMIPFRGFGGCAGSQLRGACTYCIDMGMWICPKTVYFFFFELSSTFALLLLIPLFLPLTYSSSPPPSPQVRQSDDGGSGSAGVCEPSGSLVRV